MSKLSDNLEKFDRARTAWIADDYQRGFHHGLAIGLSVAAVLWLYFIWHG